MLCFFSFSFYIHILKMTSKYNLLRRSLIREYLIKVSAFQILIYVTFNYVMWRVVIKIALLNWNIYQNSRLKAPSPFYRLHHHWRGRHKRLSAFPISAIVFISIYVGSICALDVCAFSVPLWRDWSAVRISLNFNQFRIAAEHMLSGFLVLQITLLCCAVYWSIN